MDLFKWFRKEDIFSSISQVRATSPQGWMTAGFQQLALKKVNGYFYEMLREGIPIFDAAIRRLTSLNGTLKIFGDNMNIVKKLEDFCTYVPVNDTQKGILAYSTSVDDEVFEQGFSLSELVVKDNLKEIDSLRVADSKFIVYHLNKEGRAEPWYIYPSSGVRSYTDPKELAQLILNATYNQSLSIFGVGTEVKLNPTNKFYFSIGNENMDPYGVSIMRSCEFVSQLLVTIQNSELLNWERFGNPPFHILYRAGAGARLQGLQSQAKDGKSPLDTRREKLESDFQATMNSKMTGKTVDFIQAIDASSELTISIIGAQDKILEVQYPVRMILEQVVAKTGLPEWMLGMKWGSTQGMTTHEVEMILQDTEIRQLNKLPEMLRLMSMVLTFYGETWKTIAKNENETGDWGVAFDTPNLRNMTEVARARFLNAQAAMMEQGIPRGGNNDRNSSTTV